VNDGLRRVLAELEEVPGWLSDQQAGRLFERALTVPAGGTILEIGSFRGRSTIVLARAARDDVAVIAVDPHAGSDRGPQEIVGRPDEGEADHLAFVANLRRAGVTDRIRHVRRASADALGEVDGALDLLYVDGAHRYRPARGDLRAWGRRVRPGGTMLVHDAFSSIGVTLAILRELAFGRQFMYVGRTASLAEYRRLGSPPAGTARAANTLAQLAELPWFLRNLAIKLALVLKLRRAALALGHDRNHEWPY
jgi:predicted O-methyltransferase YrrM